LLTLVLAVATAGCASGAAPVRAAHPTTGEETTCRDPGVLASPNSAPEAILQKQIADALPCVFTSTSYASPGSNRFFIYLTPLNTHSRAVAQAIVDASPASKILLVSLKQGMQSFSQAEQQKEAISNAIGAQAGLSIQVDVYGS
jgi:hypothetical protein